MRAVLRIPTNFGTALRFPTDSTTVGFVSIIVLLDEENPTWERPDDVI